MKISNTLIKINTASDSDSIMEWCGNHLTLVGNSVRLYFLVAPKSLQMVTAAMKLKDAYSLEEKL